MKLFAIIFLITFPLFAPIPRGPLKTLEHHKSNDALLEKINRKRSKHLRQSVRALARNNKVFLEEQDREPYNQDKKARTVEKWMLSNTQTYEEWETAYWTELYNHYEAIRIKKEKRKKTIERAAQPIRLLPEQHEEFETEYWIKRYEETDTAQILELDAQIEWEKKEEELYLTHYYQWIDEQLRAESKEAAYAKEDSQWFEECRQYEIHVLAACCHNDAKWEKKLKKKLQENKKAAEEKIASFENQWLNTKKDCPRFKKPY